jgi:hypothetical protein
MPIDFPSSPTVGQVFTEAGRSWVWSGATWDSPTATNTLLAPYGLELVKTQAIGTAVSTVTVTDAFSAKYENYRVIMTGANNSAASFIRISMPGPADFRWAGWRSGPFSSGVVGQVSNSTMNVGYGMAASNLPTFTSFDIIQPFATSPTIISVTPFIETSNVDNYTISGAIQDNVSRSQFTIAAATGTLTGGTIRVYGYRNA